MNITPVLEDYLERILIMQEENTVARVKDLANYFKVKAPSVVDAVSKLKKDELVEQESYGFITLTPKGMEFAKEVYKKHLLLKDFLHKVLYLNEEIAEDDACKIEHYLSKETIEHILAFMKFIKCKDGFPRWLNNFYYFADTGQRPQDCNCEDK
ncbi:Iron-dependent repressor IdeR/DtxR [Desulfurella amilsii]|uniref:Transcriptional regulator MntR n=1 Tax=Desulfurella amilsii TaxID=1562698 RepID=A0A1X4XVV9_9BACT|nr:metal-dependent transcriptional regulator [Desulfurella amilsii]OSS41679.1 Iron-dependent repressor IdeR/DtxR [Desulfurella amilsii]